VNVVRKQILHLKIGVDTKRHSCRVIALQLGESRQIAGFINGMISDNNTIKDEMFKHPELHNENGAWQSVFGLAVLPEFQNRGLAGKLLQHLFEVSIRNKRKGIVLTCEKHLISYYEKFGFVNTGLSASVHGGDVFYDMKKLL
jgi:ribosomal protein S18 acetylase RimI-like enzyme